MKKIGKSGWCSKEAKVYQVIGEDNIYFYGPAQHAMWFATQGANPMAEPSDGELQVSQLIVNKHSLFWETKQALQEKLSHQWQMNF